MAFLAPTAAISPLGAVVGHMLKNKGVTPPSMTAQSGPAIPSTIIRKNSLVNPTQSPQASPGALVNRAKYQSNY